MEVANYAWTRLDIRIDAFDVATGVPGRGKREERMRDFLIRDFSGLERRF
jgi:hypothetical protein